MRRAPLLLACACATSIALGGCVVDDDQPGDRRQQSIRAAADLPPGATIDGPIARPALEARTVNARTIAAIEPIGTIPFDGQVLPIVSPDGRRVATQVGEAPAWSTVLAERGCGPALRTRVEIWDISASPPRKTVSADTLRSVMLGRSCDSSGFLVEEQLADGSRRIGKVSWERGELRWLADDGRVNAFGELVKGGLVWCVRDIEADVFGLVRNGQPAASSEDASYLMPLAGGEGDVCVFEARARGMELQSRSLHVRAEEAAGASMNNADFVIGRRRVGSANGTIVAYQAADPVRGWAGGASGAPGLLFFHPGAGRMAIFDAGRGQLLLLEQDSIGGAWASEGEDWAVLLTTPKGLVHQRIVLIDGSWEVLPAARMLGDAFVPRATSDAERPFVLIGPARDARRVSIVGMQLLSDDDLTQ